MNPDYWKAMRALSGSPTLAPRVGQQITYVADDATEHRAVITRVFPKYVVNLRLLDQPVEALASELDYVVNVPYSNRKGMTSIWYET